MTHGCVCSTRCLGNRHYVPALYILNKIDTISIEELDLLARVPHYVPISAKDEWNFDDLMVRVNR